MGTKTDFVIVDHTETARDWYEAGDLNTKKIFTDRLGDRPAEYPTPRGSALVVAAADGFDKEVLRLVIESGANVCAPQRSSEDMEHCSGQGVDFF